MRSLDATSSSAFIAQMTEDLAMFAIAHPTAALRSDAPSALREIRHMGRLLDPSKALLAPRAARPMDCEARRLPARRLAERREGGHRRLLVAA